LIYAFYPWLHAGNILVITFTRKACKEIQDRLSLDGHVPPVQVNTFHSWAIRFLQSREIRELTNSERVTVWDKKEQFAQMGDACQRAQTDFALLPAARRCLDLPKTGQLSPLGSWAELLTAAFSHHRLKEPLNGCKARAKERVSEIIKELSVLEAAEEEDDVAESSLPKGRATEQKSLAAAMASSAADYGTLPVEQFIMQFECIVYTELLLRS
jgi:superfamily I DNA/RNA helicase